MAAKDDVSPNGCWPGETPPPDSGVRDVGQYRSKPFLRDVPDPVLKRESDRIRTEITIGIVAFRRPDAVVKQVESIRRFYPQVSILIVDNGDKPADVARFENVRYVTIAFDSGLSASRNCLIDHLQTPYLMLCDDDFVWTDDTDLEKLIDVLDAEPSVGVAGASLIEATPGGLRHRHWAQDLVLAGDVLESRPLSSPLKQTPRGARYQLCDTVMNFALFRSEMLADHRWIDELKMSEHVEYFWRVKNAGRWRVAICAEVTAKHVRQRSSDYIPFRMRPEEFNPKAYARMGVRRYCGMRWNDPRLCQRGGPLGDRPNVLVLTVGNTGSTPVTQMAMRLGWHCPDADDVWCESETFRQLNEDGWDRDAASRFLAGLPQPWVLKDPRFVHTAQRWLPALQAYQPVLVYVTRIRSDVIASYRRRGFDDPETLYDRREDAANKVYLGWPWQKLQVDFEAIKAAAAVITDDRPPRSDVVFPDL